MKFMNEINIIKWYFILIINCLLALIDLIDINYLYNLVTRPSYII